MIGLLTAADAHCAFERLEGVRQARRWLAGLDSALCPSDASECAEDLIQWLRDSSSVGPRSINIAIQKFLSQEAMMHDVAFRGG